MKEYLNKLSGINNPIMQQIAEGLARAKRDIQIEPYEARIISLFCKMIGAKNAAEIGSLWGYSAINIAEALGSDGKLYCFEKEQENCEIMRDNFAKAGVAERIEIFAGEALHNLPKIENKAPFDLVFIDADKANYLAYANWARQNLRSGGLLIADNIFMRGSVATEEKIKGISANSQQKMQEFNQLMMNDADFDCSMLPTSDGMLLGIRK